MTRFPDWPIRLEAFLTRHWTDSFTYGTRDCCLFPCSAIEVMTGTDPAATFRGSYTTRAGALQAMREYCGSPSVRRLAERVTEAFGMPSVPALRLGRGDLALIKRPRDYSLGIVNLTGQQIVVAGWSGLERIPLAGAIKGWRV
jgi:hypothetical protein